MEAAVEAVRAHPGAAAIAIAALAVAVAVLVYLHYSGSKSNFRSPCGKRWGPAAAAEAQALAQAGALAPSHCRGERGPLQSTLETAIGASPVDPQLAAYATYE